MSEPSARQFMNRLQKSVLQAASADAAIAQFPEIFEPDAYLLYNGNRFDLKWLEAHVREVYVRLENVKVEVTHAGREGNQICDRHVLTARDLKTDEDFEIEVMAAYELSASNRIKLWYELSRTCRGEYSGW